MAARNWILRVKTNHGSVKIPIQVMYHLRDPVTRLRRKRRNLPEHAYESGPIQGHIDTKEEELRMLWANYEKQANIIETMGTTISRMEEKLDQIIAIDY